MFETKLHGGVLLDTEEGANVEMELVNQHRRFGNRSFLEKNSTRKPGSLDPKILRCRYHQRDKVRNGINAYLCSLEGADAEMELVNHNHKFGSGSFPKDSTIQNAF